MDISECSLDSSFPLHQLSELSGRRREASISSAVPHLGVVQARDGRGGVGNVTETERGDREGGSFRAQ